MMTTRLAAPLRSAVATLVASLLSSASSAQPVPAPVQTVQVPAAGEQPTTAEVLAELRRLVSDLRATVDRQGNEIAELRRRLPEAAPAQTAAATPEPEATPVQPGPTNATEGAEPGRRTQLQLPPDVVSAGDFPGSFKIPGSDAALRIGGLVRVNWVTTSNALVGVQDRFVTSAIPVEGSATTSGGSRVDVIASPSRFNFDLRTPTGVGYMRAFVEGDFAGASSAFRLRHAYGQWRRIIFGQTWSTYSDPEAEPDGIDFEGLNAIVLFRQPQIRWSIALGERTRLALALEDPRPDLTGATGVSQVPDAIARVRVEPGRGGHVQVAGVIRQLRGEPVDDPTAIVGATGFGVTVSGRLPIPVGASRDAVLFQGNGGSGIGRYISDLSTLGGQDAVYDPLTRSLEPLDAFSGYVGYERSWTKVLRSSFSFGVVDVENLAIQDADALRLTRRYSMNVMWSPIPRIDLVTELLWGSRKNKDGRRGTAAQSQIGATFRF